MGPHRTNGEGQGYRLALPATNPVRYLAQGLAEEVVKDQSNRGSSHIVTT